MALCNDCKWLDTDFGGRIRPDWLDCGAPNLPEKYWDADIPLPDDAKCPAFVKALVTPEAPPKYWTDFPTIFDD